MSRRKESIFPKLIENIRQKYLADEETCINALLPYARASSQHSNNIEVMATSLIKTIQIQENSASGLQAFLNHYDLSSHEGVVLMCVAEALLRIPDSETMDALISDKISSANWAMHIGESHSLFVNASTWALMLTGQSLKPNKTALKHPQRYIRKIFARMEEPVVRTVIKSAMRIMAFQFVMGRTISEALKRSHSNENLNYRYSFDMLGEAAITTADTDRYEKAYIHAIETVGATIENKSSINSNNAISIKLSALCPRFEYRQQQRSEKELSVRLLKIAKIAREAGIGLTIDAEEAYRLGMTLRVFEKVYRSPELDDWEGLGLVVQCYQKRALGVLKWLNRLAKKYDRVIPLRLVKGAYWDTEIKNAQEQGLSGYPVFTRKSNTDISYQACVRYLLEECLFLYPQFATHNAQTLAFVYYHAGTRKYEFQRLHGMGENLYAEFSKMDKHKIPCRVYAPVGAHEQLLPYLVRRLLENGANTSFVNQMTHSKTGKVDTVNDPVRITEQMAGKITHPKIPLPVHIFGKERLNSSGVNFSDPLEVEPLLKKINLASNREWLAKPIVNGKEITGPTNRVFNPATGLHIGNVVHVDKYRLVEAIDIATEAWPEWELSGVKNRAAILEEAANLYEKNQHELIALCVSEAGKTIIDSHGEVREAIDFLRYYASQAKKLFNKNTKLPGPTGECNVLRLRARGVFACISPWNFPLAIFTGQIAAALVSGNSVIAKPAEQTSLTAHYATTLLLEAGIPPSVLQVLPGTGKQVGETIVADPRIAGVVFTGSCETASIINRTLSKRNGSIATLIAETGGQNAMLADSSALPEQVVLDVVQSAFNSAGQRCSALRVLYLQEDIADEVLLLLKGCMDELVMGDPMQFSTDVGPVIDRQAQAALQKHVLEISRTGKIIHQCVLPEELRDGYFVAPIVIEINNIVELENENFGPVLHVIRYQSNELDHILDQINDIGYGLTLGIHSRIENRADEILERVKVGNVYVNRNMVGAVVGVQPFGGCGLSGTGPKAGGPNYLLRFANEQTFTVNTAAIGGNASLLTMT
jgi:RHH-type transcriptional regulator, proline utilization regulon repressor / proline dehydrogenase / delta 1-pyrroline-5-carboxylate dehydrogenase